MTLTPLWQPGSDDVQNAKMSLFIDFINNKYNLKNSDYLEFHDWSISCNEDFWESLLEFLDINFSGETKPVVSEVRGKE